MMVQIDIESVNDQIRVLVCVYYGNYEGIGGVSFELRLGDIEI